MAKTYQYEYALFKQISGMFNSVSCASVRKDTLKLHYMDLVTENHSGNPSYKKQREMDGVYAFTLHVEMNKKKTRASRIHVRNYCVVSPQ